MPSAAERIGRKATFASNYSLRSRLVSDNMSTEDQQPPMERFMRPYGPPPHFKGRPDEDLEDWMLLYERYATALSWTEAQKANNLVFALEDEARHWFSTALREATAEAPLTTWEQWQQLSRPSGLRRRARERLGLHATARASPTAERDTSALRFKYPSAVRTGKPDDG